MHRFFCAVIGLKKMLVLVWSNKKVDPPPHFPSQKEYVVRPKCNFMDGQVLLCQYASWLIVHITKTLNKTRLRFFKYIYALYGVKVTYVMYLHSTIHMAHTHALSTSNINLIPGDPQLLDIWLLNGKAFSLEAKWHKNIRPSFFLWWGYHHLFRLNDACNPK